jgi:hypothetical protein
MKEITSILSSKLTLAKDLWDLDMEILFLGEGEMYRGSTEEFLNMFQQIYDLPRHNTGPSA